MGQWHSETIDSSALKRLNQIEHNRNQLITRAAVATCLSKAAAQKLCDQLDGFLDLFTNELSLDQQYAVRHKLVTKALSGQLASHVKLDLNGAIFQIAAEALPQQKITALIRTLNAQELIRLLGYSALDNRLGGQKIICAIELDIHELIASTTSKSAFASPTMKKTKHKINGFKALLSIIADLRKERFSGLDILNILDHYPVKTSTDFIVVEHHLEKAAETYFETSFQALQRQLSKIKKSLDALEQNYKVARGKKLIEPQLCRQAIGTLHETKKKLATLQFSKLFMKRLFDQFYGRRLFTLKIGREFGNMDPPTILTYKVEKIGNSIEMPIQLLTMCQYAEEICEGLETIEVPSRLSTTCAKAFKEISIAFPTYGEPLEELSGLQALIVDMQMTFGEKARTLPIFVYDQNKGATFLKNQQYINRLRRCFPNAKIVHMSWTDCTKLAEKIGISELVISHCVSEMPGLGGCRNLSHLGATILPLVKEGMTVAECVKLDAGILKKLYSNRVLTPKSEENIGIWMFDNDETPLPGSCLAKTIAVNRSQGDYSRFAAFRTGRQTMRVLTDIAYPEFLFLACLPQNRVGLPKWDQVPISVGLASVIFMKNSFWYPVVLPTTEGHNESMPTGQNYLAQQYHHCGDRLPKPEKTDGLPESRKILTMNYAKQCFYGRIGFELARLIDCTETYSPIFPHNDPEKQISNLLDAWKTLTTAQNIVNFQLRLLHNMIEAFFQIPERFNFKFIFLSDSDIPAVTKAYKETTDLIEPEERLVDEMGVFFQEKQNQINDLRVLLAKCFMSCLVEAGLEEEEIDLSDPKQTHLYTVALLKHREMLWRLVAKNCTKEVCQSNPFVARVYELFYKFIYGIFFKTLEDLCNS